MIAHCLFFRNSKIEFLYYATTELRKIYFFERRNSLYYNYWTLKFQLHTIYNWRIVLINTLYFLFSILNIRDFVNFAILFATTFLFFQKQNIKHIFISIVWVFITNNEKKRLRTTVVIELIKFLKRFNQNVHLLTTSIFVRSFLSLLNYVITRCLTWNISFLIQYWRTERVFSSKSQLICDYFKNRFVFVAMISTFCFIIRFR